MKYFPMIFFYLCFLVSGCIPVHRHVEWTSVTHEQGWEKIGARDWKHYDVRYKDLQKIDEDEEEENDDEDGNEDEEKKPMDSMIDAKVISLAPYINEIYDFSR